MEITKAQYNEIIHKQEIGDILLYIDTANFRKFFTEANQKQIEQQIGEPLYVECFIIKLIVFLLEPLMLLITVIASIYLLKWFAILLIPALILLWFFLKSMASSGKQSIFFPSVLLVAGAITVCLYGQYGFWFKLLVIGILSIYFFSKLLYYLSARFAFMLIHRNYEFFRLFYEKPEGALMPMIWSKKMK